MLGFLLKTLTISVMVILSGLGSGLVVQNVLSDAEDGKRIQKIKQSILAGDYEQANSLFSERFDQVNIEPTWKYYAEIVSVRDHIHFYRKYRLALDSYNSTNKDWSKIMSLLLDLPEGFKYKEEANKMLAEGRTLYAKRPTVAGTSSTRPVSRISNKIECVGPDQIHFWTTQEECNAFNNAWKKPNGAQINITNSSYRNDSIDCVLSYGTFKVTQSDCNLYRTWEASLPPPTTSTNWYFPQLTAPDLWTVPTYGPIPDIAGSVQAEMDKSLQEFQDSQQMGTTCSSQGVCPVPTSVPAWFDSVP